jgi:hypothetical protein
MVVKINDNTLFFPCTVKISMAIFRFLKAYNLGFAKKSHRLFAQHFTFWKFCLSNICRMDFKQLNNDLVALVIKRNLLASINYNDEAYDQVEEDLHDTEDEFLENYDSYLEEVLQTVHDEYCPETDVLLPIAYLAKKYIVKTDAGGNVIYGVGPNEGLLVESELHPNRSVRLILLPSPIRIVMTVDNSNAKVVWEVK